MSDRERQKLEAELHEAKSAARYLAVMVAVLLGVVVYSFGGP